MLAPRWQKPPAGAQAAPTECAVAGSTLASEVQLLASPPLGFLDSPGAHEGESVQTAKAASEGFAANRMGTSRA